jgi:hypothetical protein
VTALDVDGIDWDALRRIRAGFLDGSAGSVSYWTSESDLESYDRTFGERIGWKWDHVLDELERRGWHPPDGIVLDWACGSGIAGRRFVARFGGALDSWDRSTRAVTFARAKAREEDVALGAVDGDPATLLISHVVGELPDVELTRLVEFARRATAVVWVEPGDHASSRALIAVRERLIGDLSVVAPCTHQNACPMAVEGEMRDWCHHFARAPWEVFADPGWARFSNEMGIDLHSTPLSFLVMDRRPGQALPAGTMHLVGSPRVHKPHVFVYGCDDSGLHGRRLTKRRHPDLYRQAKKGNLDAIAEWAANGDEIVAWKGLPAAEPATDD